MSFKVNDNGDSFFLDELFKYILSKWLFLFISSGIGFAFAVYFSLQLPNIYKAEALLAPSGNEGGSSELASLSGQFGGLASMAGINLGGSNQLNKTELAVTVLQSRRFLSEFIEKRDILPDLMAAESWNLSTDQVFYNPLLYDAQTKEWIRVVDKPLLPKPSIQEAYEVFKSIVSIKENTDIGTYTLSVEHLSPSVARQWVDWLVEDINEKIKQRDLLEAKKSTDYLSEQLELVQVSEMKNVLYRLIEEQAKTIMFARVRDEYVFQTIDPALTPERKFKPKRALICVLGALLGGVLVIILLIVRFNIKATSKRS
ncbi:Wzz/FepE/Etk N-terminal domain-containing protein [Pseudoalteromonas sp. SS15]|uniref:Wzz/FepE/Etk N-terminal domain-containing protein n=1 Tax=Pseudoalteromonas sp. SS15 TaxID=3139393 RepID=UPI003BA9B46C